jgi:hypothetical protein
MPIKKNLNHVTLWKQKEGEVLSYFTHSKRSHFTSESKIYEDLQLTIRIVNPIFSVHLTTYPFIAIHVVCGNTELLQSKENEIEKAIMESLERQLVQT